MSTFVQIGTLFAANNGYFNAQKIVGISFTTESVISVALDSSANLADNVGITLSSADATFETHRVIAQFLISAAQGGSAIISNFPAELPGGRTVTMAIG